MHGSPHARALAIALALLVVGSAWLLFEYDQQRAAKPPVEHLPPAVRHQTDTMPAPTAKPPTALPDNVSVIYQCDKGGRIVFSDRPCSNAGAKTVSVRAAPKEAPRDHRRELDRMKATAEKMETARRERESAYAGLAARQEDNSAAQARELQCRQIDADISQVDALLRQPHSAQRGDQLTAQRRQLTDLRFSTGC